VDIFEVLVSQKQSSLKERKKVKQNQLIEKEKKEKNSLPVTSTEDCCSSIVFGEE